MLEPHGSPMKWPGTSAEEEAGEAGLQNVRAAQTRSQDDAAVHYVFSREPPEAELSSLAPKQRWAVGDDNIVENQDKWKNAPPIPMNNMQQQGVPLKNPQTSQQQFINQAIASSVGTLTMNQSVIGTHPSHLTTNMVHTQLTPLQNHALNNSLAIQNSAMILPQLQGMQNPQLGQQGIYDIHHPGNAIQAMNGISKSGEHLMYLSQAGILAPGTNQFLQQGQNQLGLTPVAAIRNQSAPRPRWSLRRTSRPPWEDVAIETIDNTQRRGPPGRTSVAKEQNRTHDLLSTQKIDISQLAITLAARLAQPMYPRTPELSIFSVTVVGVATMQSSLRRNLHSPDRARKPSKTAYKPTAARDAVQCLFVGSTTTSEGMRLLQLRFGRPDALVMAELKKQRELPRLKGNPRDVCMFASRVSIIIATIKALGRLRHYTTQRW